MADAFRTIIIPASGRVNGKTISAAFDRVGPEMFPTPLSASGADPATHYISSGYIPTGYTNNLPFSTWALDMNGSQWVQTVVSTGNPSAVRTFVNNKLGTSFTLTQVTNFLNSLDISDQEPFVAMGRLGLKIINPPII